jgi:DNA repair exonuclease SbcCD ATPase subunit
MIRFTHMRIENFLSFGKAEFNFADQGLTLVEGENEDDKSAKSNGAGKSALVDALVWCLFGTTLRGYENDEVVHRRVGEDCIVLVTFEDGDEIYTVARTRRHSKYKNTLRVINDNVANDMSGPSTAETQAVVERLLGCSLRTFMSSVVFGQDRAYCFSSLTDKEQKEVLDEVLGVERFADACQLARQLTASVDGAVDKITAEAAKAEELREAAQGELDDLHAKDAKFESDHEVKLEAERKKMRAAQERADQESKVDLEKLQKTLATRRSAVDAAETAVTDAELKLSDAWKRRGTAQGKVDECRGRVKRQEQLVGTCPTCDQPIPEKKHASALAEVQRELVPLIKAHDKVEAEVQEHTKAVKAAKEKREAARDAVREAEDKHGAGVSAAANAKAFRQRAADHKKRLEEIEAETNPYSAMVEKVEKRAAKYGKEAELLATQLAAEEARLKVSRFWVEAFGTRGLRSLLLDTSLPILNAEAARVSRAVTGGAISVEFSATSDLKNGKTVDKFEVRVDNKHGAGTYAGNSAGERAKVDLCVGLAIQKLVASRSSSTFNVAFFDECLDHLDSSGSERVLDILSTLASNVESVYVISHSEDVQSWFPNVLRVVKKGGFSVVEDG